MTGSRASTCVALCALGGVLGAALACEPTRSPASARATAPAARAPASNEAGDAAGPPAVGTPPASPPPDAQPKTTLERARELAQRLVILDGHVDAPHRLDKVQAAAGTDAAFAALAHRGTDGDFDFERARQGGLDIPFFSIYVASSYEKQGARARADHLIDTVEALTRAHPERFALAPSVSAALAAAASGKLALALGIENGSALEGKLDNVGHFHRRGVRYITLTHFKDNHLSDSATDGRHTHGGLSEFGKQVVAEMNRVGILVDVSHLSDQAFWDVVEISRVPVIASHSGCRHFTPGFARNLSDDMIRALAKNGGVAQINFGSQFLVPERRRRASVEHVADHIDHVVRLVGIEHVGLGSDFDGVGDTLPSGLRDVSEYPNLLAVLLERGYAEGQIEAICSGNVLRVWRKAEQFAASSTTFTGKPVTP